MKRVVVRMADLRPEERALVAALIDAKAAALAAKPRPAAPEAAA